MAREISTGSRHAYVRIYTELYLIETHRYAVPLGHLVCVASIGYTEKVAYAYV
jgi:hypothetical protein